MTASWKNRLLTLFVRLFAPKPRASSEKRFLILSTTALGDTLWATPALSSLRRRFPDAFLAVLTSPLGKEVLENHPGVDRLYVLKKPEALSFFSLLWKLRKERFSTVFLFHVSQRLMVPLAALLGASEVIGSKGRQKGLDALLTKAIDAQGVHEIQRRLDLVGAPKTDLRPQFFLRSSAPFPREKRKVLLHPGAKDSYKRWPLAHFATLGQRLRENLSCSILITGNQSEILFMQRLKEAIPGAVLAPPSLPLEEFAREIAKASLLITNDTGPLHLAAALGTPALGLYVPTDPKLCGPMPPAIALFRPPTCTPCLGRKCKEPFCFFQIGVDEVFEKAQKLLKGGA